MYRRRSNTNSSAGIGPLGRLRWLGSAGLWCTAVFLSLGAVCSTFEPRPAPEPCDPNTDPTCRVPRPLEEPLTPEIMRDNYRNLIEDFNPENLQETLAEDFLYIPDTQALGEAQPGFFDDWNKEAEDGFTRNLVESGDLPINITLEFLVFVNTGELSLPEARYNVEYELTLEFANPERLPERYCARARWDLVGGDQNFWQLRIWEDRETLDIPDDPCIGTMGSLRATRGR